MTMTSPLSLWLALLFPGGARPQREDSPAAQALTFPDITVVIDDSVETDHCRLSASLQAAYGAGREVRLCYNPPGGCIRLGLCTVDAVAHDGPRHTLQVNSATFRRRFGAGTASPLTSHVFISSTFQPAP
jgi:hypothetical protein